MNRALAASGVPPIVELGDLPGGPTAHGPSNRGAARLRVIRPLLSLFFAVALFLPLSTPAQSVGLSEIPRITRFRFTAATNSLGVARLSPAAQRFIASLAASPPCNAFVASVSAENSSSILAHLSGPIGQSHIDAVLNAGNQQLPREGYINSGILLPDQKVLDGTVTFLVVEGELGSVVIHGTQRLSPRWIRGRIRAATPSPLLFRDLEGALRQLKGSPMVAGVEGSLHPFIQDGSVVPGSSVLDVRVTEASPFRLDFQADNQRPPSVGAEHLWLSAAHLSLTGHDDPLRLEYGIAQRARGGGVEFSALDNVGIDYSVPISLRDTRVGASFDRRDYAVIEEPFQDLDIESGYWAAGVRVSQPLFRRGGRDASATLMLDRRHTEGTLLGEPFSFSPGTVDGEGNVTALRLSLAANDSRTNQVLALRFTTSVGIDAFESTVLPHGVDGRFVSVLGQAQYLRHLGGSGGDGFADTVALRLRAAFQWADGGLLAMEQLSLGGLATVRGYRENLLVRDTGLVLGAELPFQALRRRHFALELAPFIDFGAGWNVDAPTPDPVSLASVGVSLRALVVDRVQIRFDWGYALNDRPTTVDDLQDLGIHFSVGVRAF